MKVQETALSGCFLISGIRAMDSRGVFSKCFSNSGLPCLKVEELFYTVSARGTLRGMHLQEPPFQQHKLVFCVGGHAFDAMVDLRVGSPTYGEVWTCSLSANEPHAVLIAPGVAHGFLAHEDNTVLVYATTSAYSPEHDRGVRWDSIGLDWPFSPSHVSPRDLTLPALCDYESPFCVECIE